MSRGKDLSHFVLLIVVWLIGIFIYLQSPSFLAKRIDVVVMALVYPVWGAWHHLEHGRLKFSIILEYSLVALIALVGFLAIVPGP